MALSMRLSRGGSKKRPYYRIVIADARSPRDGKFIEKIGTYNPLLAKDSDERIKLDGERASHWLKMGAQPSDRVARFLDVAGIRERPARNNPNKAKPGEKATERADERAEKAKAADEAKREAEEAAKAKPAEEAPAEEPATEESATEETAPADEAAPAAEAAPAEEAAAVEETAAAEEAAPADEAAPVEEAAAEPTDEDATNEGESASKPAEG